MQALDSSRVRHSFRSCVTAPSLVGLALLGTALAATQTAGLAALAFRDEMDERVHTLVAERHRMAEALRRLPGITVYPSGANFVLIRAHGDGRAVWEALVERGVLVRDFSRWPRLDECLRITVGTAEENDRFLAALREILTEESA